MTGGVIYVAGNREALAARVNPQQLSIEAPTVAEQKLLRELLETHERLTGSRVARSLLRFDRHLAGFCRITPVPAAIAAPIVEAEAEPVAEAV
jgi:glutamate synthase domain-containing protein 3